MKSLKSFPSYTVDPDDLESNTSANPAFDSILRVAFSRRGFLRAAAGTGGFAALSSIGLSGCGSDSDAAVPPQSPPFALKFNPIAKNLLDTVTVAPGYSSRALYRLGDPLVSTISEFKNDGTDAQFSQRAGDNHDGIEYFGLSAAGLRDVAGSQRGILAMNHEYLVPTFLHAAGPTAGTTRPASEVDKEVEAHGVSLVEVAKGSAGFAVVKDSKFNRRITAATPIEIDGPARGHRLLVTKYSTSGVATRGTQNNCGTGITPWGTFLTAEENWAGYLARAADDNSKRSPAETIALNRYGLGQGTNGRYNWVGAGNDDLYARWNMSVVAAADASGASDYRNVANTFGYVVEIDPYNAGAPVKKRSALGRLAHEAAVFGKATAGKPLAVYTGDDSRNEYIYKFVSAAVWDAADANPASGINAGDKYLNRGTLYAAKFNADGTGQWLALNKANIPSTYTAYAFADEADLLIHARLAADAVGATKMDRPEWGAVNPKTGEIYFTLTNNSTRTAANTDAANPRAYSDAQGATTEAAARTNTGNVNGHIIRFREAADDNAATVFSWDVYLFGSQADAPAAAINLSGLSPENDFSSPDGLWFSEATGAAFIQTDDGAFTDVTNCMMLMAMPGRVGDGAKTAIEYTVNNAAKRVETFVGASATTSTLKRFLVGPVECEITGVCETPDGKTLFVNVQHPGEATAVADIKNTSKYSSHWPDGGNARPRSATIVVTKDDGGVIGT
jgi:uncharacterized protein